MPNGNNKITNNKIVNTTKATLNNMKNVIKNTYNKTSTTERYIYLFCTLIIIALVIYWGIYIYNYYNTNKKYYSLVSRYAKINSQNIFKPINVYPSKVGNQLSISMWLKINSLGNSVNTTNGKKILSINNTSSDTNNNFIQLLLGDSTAKNNISCVVNTYSTNDNPCVINNVPPYTWIQLVYVFNNRNIDIYGNGKLLKSCYLQGIPKYPNDMYSILLGDDTNKEIDVDIYNLEYYGRKLNVNEVSNLYENKPNLEIISKM